MLAKWRKEIKNHDLANHSHFFRLLMIVNDRFGQIMLIDGLNKSMRSHNLVSFFFLLSFSSSSSSSSYFWEDEKRERENLLKRWDFGRMYTFCCAAKNGHFRLFSSFWWGLKEEKEEKKRKMKMKNNMLQAAYSC